MTLDLTINEINIILQALDGNLWCLRLRPLLLH